MCTPYAYPSTSLRTMYTQRTGVPKAGGVRRERDESDRIRGVRVLELGALQSSLADGPTRNAVRLWSERSAVAADELFVSVDLSPDLPYVVHEYRGALRWAEITRSDVELPVSMGAHARIDLGPRGAGVGELVAS